MNLMRIAIAFVRKDFLELVSYRFALLLGVFGLLLSLFFTSVFSDFVGEVVSLRAAGYGGNYFHFVVLGIGVYTFLQSTLYELSRRIRQAQVVGTLEALLGTRAPLAAIILCMPLFPLLQTAVHVCGILLMGTLFFGLKLTLNGLPVAAVVLLATSASFAGLGLLAAGLTIAFKRAEIVPAFLANLSLFLGGVWYPVESLPPPVQTIALALPLTHALRAMRSALLGGASLQAIQSELLALLLLAGLLLPLGFLVFRWSIRRALREGTLTQY